MRGTHGRAAALVALLVLAGHGAPGQEAKAAGYPLRLSWRDSVSAPVKLDSPPDLVVERTGPVDAQAVHLVVILPMLKDGKPNGNITFGVESDIALTDKTTIQTATTSTWKYVPVFAGDGPVGSPVKVALYRAKKLRESEQRAEADRLSEWLDLPVTR